MRLDDWEHSKKYWYAPMQVASFFLDQRQWRHVSNWSAEVASVYVQVACHLGYLEIKRRIASSWDVLQDTVASYCHEHESMDRDAVYSRFGEPSWVVQSGNSVLCYYLAGNDECWFLFDVEPDGLIRSTRRTGKNTLRMTNEGRRRFEKRA